MTTNVYINRNNRPVVVRERHFTFNDPYDFLNFVRSYVLLSEATVYAVSNNHYRYMLLSDIENEKQVVNHYIMCDIVIMIHEDGNA